MTTIAPHQADRATNVYRFFTRTPQKPSQTTATVLLAFGGGSLLLTIGSCIYGIAASGGSSALGIGGALCFVAATLAFAIPGLITIRKADARYKTALATAEPKPPVAWIRELIQHEITRLEQHALDSLRISRNELEVMSDAGVRAMQVGILRGETPDVQAHKRPLIIIGPSLPTSITRASDTGGLLFSNLHVAFICPTSFQFGIYTCALDLATGRLGSEMSRLFPYTQVSAVVAGTRPLPSMVSTLPIVSQFFHLELANLEVRYLQILVTGGDRAEVTLGFIDQVTRQGMRFENMPDFDNVVDAVSRALRQAST